MISNLVLSRPISGLRRCMHSKVLIGVKVAMKCKKVTNGQVLCSYRMYYDLPSHSLDYMNR